MSREKSEKDVRSVPITVRLNEDEIGRASGRERVCQYV